MRTASVTIRTMAAFWLSAASLALAQIPASVLAQANTNLQAGEADKALALLTPLPSSGTGAGQAQNLLCRVYFMLQQWNQASAACANAIKLDPRNSDFHMWYGRALGQQANHASLLSAYGIAKHSLAEMQTATQLDAKNGPALSDLGDYYAQAPGIAGGGTDKAENVAAQLDKVDAARAAQLRGDIASAKKDYAAAEQQYKQAIAANPKPAEQWTVLADFYRQRQRWSDLDAAIQSCVTAAAKEKSAGIALYDGAGVLFAANRNPQLAAKMLTDYLAGAAKSEDGPAFIAHIRLSQLKQQLGDAAGAKQELATAQTMAHEFNTAQALKQG